MPQQDIGSADYTNMHNIDSSSSTATTFLWEVTSVATDAATGQQEFKWQCTNWNKYLGYYHSISHIASSFDKKALWTVGQGLTFKGNVFSRFIKSRKLGLGKDTLTSILYNLDRTGQIGGDCFAEIINDKQGRLINLKPLSPGNLSIIANAYGRIIRYEQNSNAPKSKFKKFKPEEIFHIPFNRLADEIHGISDILRIEDSIKMQKEAKLDLKTVFHRYVKPLIITRVKTDDEIEIAAFKTKLDKAIEYGENMIIPSETVDEIDKISIPKFSTLDPLPWIQYLDKDNAKAMGVPDIVNGASGEGDTEASSKMLQLSWEVNIKFRQMIWEEQIKNQLGLDLKLTFPTSIAPELLGDAQKDGKMNKNPNTNPNKHE